MEWTRGSGYTTMFCCQLDHSSAAVCGILGRPHRPETPGKCKTVLRNAQLISFLKFMVNIRTYTIWINLVSRCLIADELIQEAGIPPSTCFGDDRKFQALLKCSQKQTGFLGFCIRSRVVFPHF